MKKLVAAAMVWSALALFAAPSFAASEPGDRESIEKVVETFRVSIIKKDKDTFMKLFFSETIPWMGVLTDNSLARLTSKRKPGTPEIEKAHAFPGPRGWIEGVVTSKGQYEEKFENVRIDSDGDVAQVWFDYSLYVDGYKSNWGKEAWQLVRTDAGWKINSMICSMEINPVLPPKLAKKNP